MIALLNQQLADTFDLYSQVKQAHWNVKGTRFMQLHLLFDDLASNLLEPIDMIAERAMALGGTALGTARLAAAHSNLPEFPVEVVRDWQVIELLADRFATYAASTRIAIDRAGEVNDQATMALFIEISRTIDKHLWFLEVHLSGLILKRKAIGGNQMKLVSDKIVPAPQIVG